MILPDGTAMFWLASKFYAIIGKKNARADPK